MDKNQHTDKLFRNAFSEPAPPDTMQGWMDIEKQVARIGFFRFSMLKFNVYYAALIVGTFIFAGGSLLHLKTANNAPKANNPAPIIIYDTIVVNDTTTITDTLIKHALVLKKNSKNKEESQRNKNSVMKTDSSLGILYDSLLVPQTQVADSVEMTKAGSDIIDKTQNQPKIIRKVVVKKQPVVIRDTVYKTISK